MANDVRKGAKETTWTENAPVAKVSLALKSAIVNALEAEYDGLIIPHFTTSFPKQTGPRISRVNVTVDIRPEFEE